MGGRGRERRQEGGRDSGGGRWTGRREEGANKEAEGEDKIEKNKEDDEFGRRRRS